jgi:hypothetical protein
MGRERYTIRARAPNILRMEFLAGTADGLAALVRETLRLDPFSGMIFVFRAKPADRVDESGRDKTE